MKKIEKIGRFLLNIIELYIPTIMLAIVLISFVIGVFFRYVLKNPQSWTYEMSTICFVNFVIFSSCYVQRTEKHIVFDMLFNSMPIKIKCVMRILSNLIMATTCFILTPAAFSYVTSMKGLDTQILGIPRGLVFVCFLILFLGTSIRSIVRMILDCSSFIDKTYESKYTEGEVTE